MTAVCPETRRGAQVPLDQHWTPDDMIEILADHLRERPIEGPLVEPFAGEGRIICRLAYEGVAECARWTAYEIDPRYSGALEAICGERHQICDAFTLSSWPGSIITNPPFGRHLDGVLVRVATGLEEGRCAAILLAHRAMVERRWMPAPSEVLHPRWRPCFGGARAGLPGTCWAIWRPGHEGQTASWYVKHPSERLQGELL